MKKNLGLSLLTGILFALALPPFKSGFLAYITLVPFLLLLEEKNEGEAFRWGYITGLFIAMCTLFWIGWVTLPGMIGVLLVWPLYTALFALVFRFLWRHYSAVAFILAPFLWVSIEYMQSLTELAFPWNYIGYTQSYYLPFIQFAEYTSVYGVSFWVVLLNVLLFFAWKNRKTNRKMTVTAVIFTLLIFLAPLPYGLRLLNSSTAESKAVHVSLVQGNRDPNEKWAGDIYKENFLVYETLTRQALQESPDLVIWPETAMPFYLRSKPLYMRRMHELVDSSATAILTGMMDFLYYKDGSYDHFNSAMLFQPHQSRTQTYAKMKLVPFSERVPYKTHFPFKFLKDLLWDLGIGDFGVGEEISVFSVGANAQAGNVSAENNKKKNIEYKMATAICFESVFPEHIRKYVNAGADFLIIITNDAWFGKTSAPFQHTQIAVFRAIENRRDIARCANTGISCFIDKYGRVRKSTSIFSSAVITDKVELNSQKTFYTQHGNIFVIFIALSSVLFLIVALLKKILFK